MKIVRPDSNEIAPCGKLPSIFLVGPTPRDSETPSWRPDAIEILKQLGFEGVVFVPERDDWSGVDYPTQCEWEHEALHYSSNMGCIAAWVPRDLKTMPAFTTNVEFGRFVDCGRFVYGRPDSAPKNRYLDWLYKEETGLPPCQSLKGLMKLAVEMTKEV